jgi:hypothetical protein
MRVFQRLASRHLPLLLMFALAACASGSLPRPGARSKRRFQCRSCATCRGAAADRFGLHTTLGAGDFRPADLVELTALDDNQAHVRYATTRNFLGTCSTASRVPSCSDRRRKPGTRTAIPRGGGLWSLVYDAYRPWYVTKYSGTRCPRPANSSPIPPKGPPQSRLCRGLDALRPENGPRGEHAESV